jgi:hypothetical protein
MNQKIKKFQAGKSDSPIYEKTDNRATGQLKATNEQKNSRWVLNDEEGLWRKKADGTMEKYTGAEGQNPEDFNHSSAQKLIFDNAPSHLQQKRLNQLDQFRKLQNNADIIVTANGQFKNTEGHIINPNNMSRAERVALAKQAGLKGKGFLNNVFGIGRGKLVGRAKDDINDFMNTYGKNLMQYAGTSNAETPQTTTPATTTTTDTQTPATTSTNTSTPHYGQTKYDKAGYAYRANYSTGQFEYQKPGTNEWKTSENDDRYDAQQAHMAKFYNSSDGKFQYVGGRTGSGGSGGTGGGKKIKTTPQSDAVKDYYNRRNNPSFTYQSNTGINTNPSGFGFNEDSMTVTHNGYENKTVLPSFDNTGAINIYEERMKRKQGGLIFSHEQGGLVQKKSLKQEMVYLNFQDKNQ